MCIFLYQLFYNNRIQHLCCVSVCETFVVVRFEGFTAVEVILGYDAGICLADCMVPWPRKAQCTL